MFQSVSLNSPSSWMRSTTALENAAVPLARLAAAADAVPRVPAAAVGLPRHLGVAADVVDVQIAVPPAARRPPDRRLRGRRAGRRPGRGPGRKRCATNAKSKSRKVEESKGQERGDLRSDDGGVGSPRRARRRIRRPRTMSSGGPAATTWPPRVAGFGAQVDDPVGGA